MTKTTGFTFCYTLYILFTALDLRHYFVEVGVMYSDTLVHKQRENPSNSGRPNVVGPVQRRCKNHRNL